MGGTSGLDLAVLVRQTRDRRMEFVRQGSLEAEARQMGFARDRVRQRQRQASPDNTVEAVDRRTQAYIRQMNRDTDEPGHRRTQILTNPDMKNLFPICPRPSSMTQRVSHVCFIRFYVT